MGDPSVEVAGEDREAALVQKSMAMDAILEGMCLFKIYVSDLSKINVWTL